MSKCEHWEARYLDYLEGRLRGRSLEEMRRHVQGCRNCSEMLRRLETLSRAAREMAPASLAGVECAIRLKVRDSRRRAPLRWRLYEGIILKPLSSPLAAGIAACIAVVLTLAAVGWSLAANLTLAGWISDMARRAVEWTGGWEWPAVVALGTAFAVLHIFGVATVPLLLKQQRRHVNGLA